jgi:hypothetical protein
MIQNPYAGRYVAEIAAFMEDLKPSDWKWRTPVLSLGGSPVQ